MRESTCPKIDGKNNNMILKFYSKINEKCRPFDSFEVQN
jgi:hypothetical protein